jgi:hypothetical protein
MAAQSFRWIGASFVEEKWLTRATLLRRSTISSSVLIWKFAAF